MFKYLLCQNFTHGRSGENVFSFSNALLNTCNHLEHFTINGDMHKIQNIFDFLKLIFLGPSITYNI